MTTENKPKGVRIVAAVVDTRNLTLYKADGETIIIPQGDVRLRRIVEEATPQLIRQGWAEVFIDVSMDNSYAKFEQEGSGAVKFFRIAKDKLKGLFTQVKEPEPEVTTPVLAMSIGTVPIDQMAFVAMAIAKYIEASSAPLASATPVTDYITTAGIYDVSEEDEAVAAMEVTSLADVVEADIDEVEDESLPVEEVGVHNITYLVPKLEQTMSAINEIMAHAVPVQATDFHETDVAVQGRIVETNGFTLQSVNKETDTHTIIAVVDNKIIPGMEMIKTQFGRAAKMGSTIGVENFLRRCASVVEQHQHSVEDLLKFLERADLPIADDGSIVIYKVLRRKAKNGQETGQKNYYVDCHSGKVEQFVGAYVCMDAKLVDHNRRIECSNGLHVARRGYVRSFSGDVCVLAKLAPEDVIAVPHGDANKMRVCGYHIIAELTETQYTEVKNNRPITNTEAGKELLAQVLAGTHKHKTHEVRVTGHKGDGVVVTKLNKPAPAPVVEAEVTSPVVVETEALVNPEEEILDQPTDPLDVVKAIEKAVLSRKEQAQTMYQAWLDAPRINKQDRYDALLAFKKAAKVGWDKLGISDPAVLGERVVATLKVRAIERAEASEAVANAFTSKARKAKKGKGKKVTTPSVFKKKSVTPSVFPKAEGLPVSTKTPPMPKVKAPIPSTCDIPSVNTVEGSYRERIQKLLAIGLTSTGTAGAIFKIKQQSRKSWTVLGVTPEQVEQIMKLASMK